MVVVKKKYHFSKFTGLTKSNFVYKNIGRRMRAKFFELNHLIDRVIKVNKRSERVSTRLLNTKYEPIAKLYLCKCFCQYSGITVVENNEYICNLKYADLKVHLRFKRS